jgi:hypothetical protein
MGKLGLDPGSYTKLELEELELEERQPHGLLGHSINFVDFVVRYDFRGWAYPKKSRFTSKQQMINYRKALNADSAMQKQRLKDLQKSKASELSTELELLLDGVTCEAIAPWPLVDDRAVTPARAL